MQFPENLLCRYSVRIVKASATWLFVQQLVQPSEKETSKVRIAGLLWGESNGYRWIPLTKGQ